MADESTDAGPPLRSTYWRKVWLKTTRSRALRRAPVEHRWLWIVLLLMPDDYSGRLVSDGLPLTVEEIADEAALGVEDTRTGLEHFIERGMLERDGEAFRVINFKSYQLSPEAERKRRQRQRAADLSSSSETDNREQNAEDRDSVTIPVTSHVTCHGIEGEECAEPKRPDADTPPDDPVLMTFPTAERGFEWRLPESKALEWQTTYPWLDVLSVCAQARQWLLDNPAKRKTPRGMPRFLGAWCGRDMDRGKHRRPTEWQPGDPLKTDLTPQKSIREKDVETYAASVAADRRSRAEAKAAEGEVGDDVPF